MGCCLDLRLIIFDLNVLERSSLAFLLLLYLGSGSGIEGNEKDPLSFFMYEFLLHSLALFFVSCLERDESFWSFVGLHAPEGGFLHELMSGWLLVFVFLDRVHSSAAS